MSTSENEWFVEGFDAYFAEGQVAHVLYMFLESPQEGLVDTRHPVAKSGRMRKAGDREEGFWRALMSRQAGHRVGEFIDKNATPCGGC